MTATAYSLTVIEKDGLKISMRQRSGRRGDSRTTKVRLYVQPNDKHDVEPPRGPKCMDPACQPCALRAAQGLARETDHAAWRAYRRAGIAARREVVRRAEPLLTMLRRPVHVRWSDKAGCSCGCSPGFIVEGPEVGMDVWIVES